MDEEEKCDPSIVSILGEAIYWRRDLHAYPNPVTDKLYVDIPDEKNGDLFIMDMQGNMVSYNRNISERRNELDLSGLSPGTYNIEFVPAGNKDRVVYTSRVVKVE